MKKIWALALAGAAVVQHAAAVEIAIATPLCETQIEGVQLDQDADAIRAALAGRFGEERPSRKSHVGSQMVVFSTKPVRGGDRFDDSATFRLVVSGNGDRNITAMRTLFLPAGDASATEAGALVANMKAKMDGNCVRENNSRSYRLPPNSFEYHEGDRISLCRPGYNIRFIENKTPAEGVTYQCEYKLAITERDIQKRGSAGAPGEMLRQVMIEESIGYKIKRR